MDKKTSHMILPGLAILMSLIALSSNYDLSNILGFVVSLIGLAGGAAYFLKNKYASTLLRIWIYAQIPAISLTASEALADGSAMVTEHHYVDAGQAFTFDLGLTLGTKSGDLDVKVNVVPIGLLILFRLLMLQGLVGGAVTIKKFRQDNKLGDVFPLSGSVIRPVTLGKEKHWLLVELASPLTYSGARIHTCSSSRRRMLSTSVVVHLSCLTSFWLMTLPRSMMASIGRRISSSPIGVWYLSLESSSSDPLIF